MRIKRTGKPDVDVQAGDRIDSREAVGMFRKSGKIYKLLNYDEDVHEELVSLSDAVPSPIVNVMKGRYEDTRDNGMARTRDVLVIEMKQVDNTNFFQMSNGGEARLVGWINALQDKEKAIRMKRALQAGKLAQLTDPQGFYLSEGGSPLIFIDLHKGDHQNTLLDAAITAAETRATALP